jgi:hypothetical protein
MKSNKVTIYHEPTNTFHFTDMENFTQRETIVKNYYHDGFVNYPRLKNFTPFEGVLSYHEPYYPPNLFVVNETPETPKESETYYVMGSDTPYY